MTWLKTQVQVSSMNGLKDEIINLDNIIMRLLDNSQQLQGKCRKERREYR